MLLFVRKHFLTIQSNHLVLVKWISFYILFKHLLENTVPGTQILTDFLQIQCIRVLQTLKKLELCRVFLFQMASVNKMPRQAK